MKRFYCIALTLAGVIAMMSGCNKPEPQKEAATFTLSESSIELSGYGDNKAIEINANRSWTAEASDDWFSISPEGYPSNGSTIAVTFTVSADANEMDTDRSGCVIFTMEGEEVAVLDVMQKSKANSEKKDGEDPFPISWMNLQWTAGNKVVEGQIFEAACCVFADGLTNAVESTTGEDILCEIGYTTGTTMPWEDGWTWVPCYFNGDWGDNFLFQVKVSDIPVGKYTYTFRAYKEAYEGYKYAGTDGCYDGENNLFGSFEITSAAAEDPIDYTNLVCSWANLQWAASEKINPGEIFEAGSCIFIDGYTNNDEVLGYENPKIVVEMGFSSTSSDPKDDSWTWKAAYYNGDWGNNHYYQCKSDEISAEGTYYYSFRINVAEKGWVYAGSDGLWDGSSNVCKTFTVGDVESHDDDVYKDCYVSWANIQWTASNTISAGEILEAGTKVLVDGLTNAYSDGTDNDKIVVDMGYSTSSDPTTGEWTWTSAYYNGDWGNEYYYQCKSGAINTPGTYYYCFRIKLTTHDYVYAGTNGIWNAESSPCGVLTVN